MTDNVKKFLELASSDSRINSELQAAQAEALNRLLEANGLVEVARKASAEAMIKVAQAHGFELTASDLDPDNMGELSEEELSAVAGGRGGCGCVTVGAGAGDGLKCGCFIGGAGADPDGGFCACAGHGVGVGGSD